MQRNARNAYKAIAKLETEYIKNVHLIDHGDQDEQWGAHFLIGCEPRTGDDWPVGDIYQEYIREYRDENGKIQNAFGIRTEIHDILDQYGLYAEWINGALFGIYDI